MAKVETVPERKVKAISSFINGDKIEVTFMREKSEKWQVFVWCFLTYGPVYRRFYVKFLSHFKMQFLSRATELPPQIVCVNR